ncbi:MAG TPA: efflux RND transporter periplasmic adaptor subunit [Acidobacteriota bacterium]|nr:efflux RND transporter periplasmic adaptor subunit [Acidobacteriota bacterium]
MAKKRLFTLVFISVVALLVVLGGYWVFGALFSVDKSIPPEKIARVELGSIARSVVATGKVEPLSKVEIKSKATGLIKYLYVNAGDPVREGQLLVELDKETLEAQMKEAKAVLDSARSNLEEMELQGKTFQANLRKAQLEAENKDYEFLKAEHKRQQELFQEGLISKSDLDSMDQKMQAAGITEKSLKASVSVREAEIAQNGRTIEKTRAAVIQAQAQYERAEENLRYASIRSPINGVVLSREVEVGDAVSSILQLGSNATLIMTLGDVRELYIKGKVDETDIGLVKMDQPVRITVDAFKNRTFQGKVIRIAPMGVEQDNVTRFEVRVSILNDLDLLKANMSANAEIILEEHHNVPLIPESALIYNEKRETFVELPDVSTKTGRRQVPIKAGLGNGARTEVLSGLKLGQPIILQ